MILQFGIYNGKYVTLEGLKYKDIEVPSGFEFDGVTVKAPFTLLFSNKDLRQGIRASCFHDWMCQHKDIRTNIHANMLQKFWSMSGKKTGLKASRPGLLRFASMLISGLRVGAKKTTLFIC